MNPTTEDGGFSETKIASKYTQDLTNGMMKIAVPQTGELSCNRIIDEVLGYDETFFRFVTSSFYVLSFLPHEFKYTFYLTPQNPSRS